MESGSLESCGDQRYAWRISSCLERERFGKYDNCAWIYSECAGIIMLGKYEYYRNCAWNILGNSAWNILEQYDNWQVVL